MKYQFLVLYDLFKKKMWKWIFVYLVFLGIYLFTIAYTFDTEFFYVGQIENLLLVSKVRDYDFLTFLLFLYKVFLTFYIVYSFYVYEYNNSYEFLSLRMAPLKRIFFKFLTLLFFVFFLNSMHYLLLYFVFHKYYAFHFLLYMKTSIPYLLFTCFLFFIIHFFYYLKK